MNTLTNFQIEMDPEIILVAGILQLFLFLNYFFFIHK